jgi:hypothetical protein
MTISIDGTNGISGVDGSAATPALQGTDTNTGISFGTDEVNVVTGGTTRATVDSSGRLLVGTSSDSQTSTVTVQGNSSSATGGAIFRMRIGTATPADSNTTGVIKFEDNSGGTGAEIEARRDGGTWSGSSKPSRLVFSTTADGASSPTERMRISASGQVRIERSGDHFFLKQSSGNFGWVQSADQNDGSFRIFRHNNGTNTEGMRINNAGSILVNTTSSGPGGASVTGRVAILFNPSTHGGLVISSNSGAGTLQQFTNTAFGVVGSITTNGTSTAFNTSSDYRLKENIQYLDGAIDRLKQLPVHRFNFIANADVTVDGFLAHEVQAVIPEAVTGTKDEVGKDGNPIYQGIDQSKLVPLLTAALQEAIAKIETLETANASQAATIAALDARLTALEGGAS